MHEMKVNILEVEYQVGCLRRKAFIYSGRGGFHFTYELKDQRIAKALIATLHRSGVDYRKISNKLGIQVLTIDPTS